MGGEIIELRIMEAIIAELVSCGEISSISANMAVRELRRRYGRL